MKLRQGFVSNSSSTSFYMIVKGNSIENLFFMLKKYGDYFNLSYEDCNGKLLRCTYTDIISELKTVGIDNFFTLNSLIKDSIHRIKFDEELLIIEKLSGNNKWPLEHYKKSISDQEKKINISLYHLWVSLYNGGNIWSTTLSNLVILSPD